MPEKKRYVLDSTSEIDEFRELVKELLWLKAQEEEIKARKQAISERIKQFMNATGLKDYTMPGVGRVKYTEFKRRKFDTRRFKEEHPEIYETYLVEDTVSQLRIILADAEVG